MSGTSTPICDLIEKLLSQGQSRLSLGQALEIARPLEETISRKSGSLDTIDAKKREKERLRKANYRANLKCGVPQIVPGTNGTETLIVVNTKTVDVVKKTESKTQTVPRDKAGHLTDWPTDYREQFWKIYPRKTEKKSAMAKLEAVRKSSVPWARFINGVKRYATSMVGTEERYVKHPTTWLNRGCWDDEYGAGNEFFGQSGAVPFTRSAQAGADPILAGLGPIADRIAQRKLAEGPVDGQVGFGFDPARQHDA